MTDKPTPKEIDDLVYELRQAGKDDTYSLVCAVLAKWGTPAGAGEPFGYFHQLLNHEGKGNGVWLGAAERKVVEQAHTPGETSEEIVTLYTTPQPTQTQPVEREPLSDDEVDSLCKVGPVYAHDGKVTLTPPQYRYELESAQRYGLRKGERAHGIKKRDPHVE